jgi:hypothetical protein
MRACFEMIAKNTLVAKMILMAASLAAAPYAAGQTNIQPMLARLATEATAYERLALQVTGEESIHQRVLKPPPHFHPRVGEAAKRAPQMQWRERDIVSLYGISLVGPALHEIRQVVFVDGKGVQGEAHAQETLSKLLTSSGDQQKLHALRQLEKYSLGGAATDFGPMILVFAHGGAERYEFTAEGPRLLGAAPARGYRFKQLDGSESLTLFAGQPQKLRMEGEIWVADAPQGPIRITLSSEVPGDGPRMREEASVDYERSTFGALLPAHIEQRERQADEVTAENIFSYSNFQRLSDR